jgi:hypothetical protein
MLIDPYVPNYKEVHILSTPIGILLGHVVCKDGIKVDMEKIKFILDLKPPVNKKNKKSSWAYWIL